jgi:hypothetical protein
MQCKKVIHLFSPFVDGELMIEEEDRIEQHLDGCPQCRTEYTKLRNMMSLMGQLPEEDPGEEFSRQVMRRIRTADKKSLLEDSIPWRERLAQWFALQAAPRPIFGMAATLVLGIVVGAGIYQILGGNPPDSLNGFADRSGTGMDASPVVATREAPAATQPTDSLSNHNPEFVLDPYIMEDELRQVAVPLYPRNVINVIDVSPKDDTITF